MKISVKQTKEGVFSLNVEDSSFTLDMVQMKKLLLEAIAAMAPGAMPAADPTRDSHTLAAKLKGAAPAGLQQLILAATDDEVLMFLKSNAEDTAFIDTMFANMSARTQAMFKEDLEFRFTEGVPDEDLSDALEHLNEVIAKLEGDGLLEFTS